MLQYQRFDIPRVTAAQYQTAMQNIIIILYNVCNNGVDTHITHIVPYIYQDFNSLRFPICEWILKNQPNFLFFNFLKLHA